MSAAGIVTHDLLEYPRPALTVDVCLLTVHDGAPHVLCDRRLAEPFLHSWALPGGFVDINQSLEGAAAAVITRKTGLSDVHLQQLGAFGAPERDPRMRVVSIAHFALVPAKRLIGARGQLMRVDAASMAELAFDHARIVAATLARIREQLYSSAASLATLETTFTLAELRAVHEAILDVALTGPAFRRKIIGTGQLRATGTYRGGVGRPAELYRAA